MQPQPNTIGRDEIWLHFQTTYKVENVQPLAGMAQRPSEPPRPVLLSSSHITNQSKISHKQGSISDREASTESRHTKMRPTLKDTGIWSSSTNSKEMNMGKVRSDKLARPRQALMTFVRWCYHFDKYCGAYLFKDSSSALIVTTVRYVHGQ